MSGSTSFTLAKRPSALDTTRRRGPPSPLVLGAACKRKISRTYEKYPEPNLPGLEQFVTRDTCCDRIIRGPHQRKASLDLEWLGQRISRRSSASGNSDTARSHCSSMIAESHAKNDRTTPPRTFDGIYGNSYIEVDTQSTSEGNVHSRQSSIDSISLVGMSESRIALPPLCLLDHQVETRGNAQQHVARS